MKDFLLDESGTTSKRSLIRLGILSSLLSISAHSSLAVENTGWHYLLVTPDNFKCHDPNVLGYTDRFFAARVRCTEPLSEDDCEVQIGAPDVAGNKILWPDDFTDEDAFDWRSNHYCKDEHWDEADMPWVHVTSCDLADESEYIRADILFDDVPVHENSLNLKTEGSELTAEHEHSITLGASMCDYEVYIEGHDKGGITDCETWIKYDARYKDSGEVIVDYPKGKDKECFDMG